MTGPWEFERLCSMGGAMLRGAPADVDFDALLYAIGGVESSFGKWIGPRHENAYCRGGRYYDRKLTRKHNCLAHCSYGPWQVMYANVARINARVDPSLMLDPLHALPITVQWLEYIIERGAGTVAQIADAWNSGSHRDAIVPVRYIEKVERLYAARVS